MILSCQRWSWESTQNFLLSLKLGQGVGQTPIPEMQQAFWVFLVKRASRVGKGAGLTAGSQVPS